MKITSARIGFATSSSSNHSPVVNHGGLHDAPPEYGEGYYGWDMFVLSSRDAKLKYLAVTLYENLWRDMGKDFAAAVASSLTGVNVQTDFYVDHQSCITLPRVYPDWGIDLSFFEELVRQIADNENVAIVGGNDNVDFGPDDYFDVIKWPLFKDSRSSNIIARKDTSGFWTLFNTTTGTRVRFWFESGDPVNKSSTPELVDVKITNYCTKGCKYCYQDSGYYPGSHVPMRQVYMYIDVMKEMGVFEVAIGGGEPTEHPDFLSILNAFKRDGIVANFSTRDLRIFHDPQWRGAVGNVTGQIAISVDGYRDSRYFFEEIFDRYYKPSYYSKFSIHVVDRTVPEYYMEYISREASKRYIPVVVLGYKRVGRGADFDPAGAKWTCLLNKRPFRLSVDSMIVRQYSDVMEKFPYITHADAEGKFSMYWDWTTNTIGKSSYDVDTFVKMPDNVTCSDIVNVYKRW